jgi:hypothetical protein
MARSTNLAGKRFGKLVVESRADITIDRYYGWVCRCDCGNRIIVDTRRLNRGTITSCGCAPKKRPQCNQIKDITGKRFGALVVTGKVLKDGYFYWSCLCDCGNTVQATYSDLKRFRVRDCGCGLRASRASTAVDLTGRRFGRLVAVEPTERRDGKGSIVWKCLCDCGNTFETTEDALVSGNTVSCGCRREEVQEIFGSCQYLTLVDGTCVEVLEKRKHRSDNKSGFRGVTKAKSGSYRVTIGLQGKRYHIGTFRSFERAVEARLEAERLFHGGFLAAWRSYQKRAGENPAWAKDNPFYFHVEKGDGYLSFHSVLDRYLA